MENNSQKDQEEEEEIMAFLINLPPHHFYTLTQTLTSDLCFQNRRLAYLLLSPHHFSQTISYLHSISLPKKTVLLAHFLLRSLSKLLSFDDTGNTALSINNYFSSMRFKDYDAALLLMNMCEVYDKNKLHDRDFDWRLKISEHLIKRTLCAAELGAGWSVVGRYVDEATKCRRLMEAVSGTRQEKAGSEVAASVATVVALPSVECEKEGWECVVCKEEIRIGRDVCVMPCQHRFHWGCILTWLRKHNTCPYCRFELPTDDVFCEIDRLWRNVIRMGSARVNCCGEN